MKRRTYLATVASISSGVAVIPSMGGQRTGVVRADEHEHEHDGDGEHENGDDETDELIGTFDDFEDLDVWTEYIGSMEAETDHYYEGSQSARLSPAEDGQVRVRRALEEPIDVSDVGPGLAMATDESGTVLIQLHDSDGDYVEYSQQVLRDMPLTRKNFGLSRVNGDPDLTNVQLLQIIRWFGTDEDEDAENEGEDDEGADVDDDGENESEGEGEGDEPEEDEIDDGEVLVDDFHFVPRPETGQVMLQFHGGYETHYTEVSSILAEYNLPATTFVPTDRIRPDSQVEGDRLTMDQLTALSDAGWTIGSYSRRGLNLTTVDADELEADIVEPVEWLTENGFEDGARFFAFPGSRYDSESYRLVQETYDLAFAGRTPSQGYAANPHLCSVVHNPGPEEVVSLLNWTVAYGGITSIAFYQIEEADVVTAIEEMASHLDDLQADDHLEVITPDVMANEFVL